MSRGYKNYDEEEQYNDGWGNTAYSGKGYSDHVCRPVVVDAEGRKHPIIRYTSSHNTEGYVMKAERTVEHISHAAPVVSLVPDYRYSYDEPLVDHKRYGQLGSAYDCPEREEDFLTKVQNAVSRPVTKASGPFVSNWRARPNSTGKDHGITGSTNYADDSNLIRDKQSDAYPQIYKGTNPMINNNNRDMYFERPRGNEGPVVPSHMHPLSKPTNDIGSAVEFLAEAIKPNHGTSTQKTDVSRPIKAGPLSSVHWRTGTNLAAQDHNKMDSGKDDDWEKPKEQPNYARDRYDNFRERTNPINNKEGNEKANGNASAMYFAKPTPSLAPSQQPRFTASTMQTKEMYPSSEAIDSSEARRRYGKLKNQPVPEEAYSGTIDSNLAMEKYKGAKVPW